MGIKLNMSILNQSTENNKKINVKKTKNKYLNKRICRDGVWYDSINEYDRFRYLQLLERGGEISDLRYHSKEDWIILNDFPLMLYKPDYSYIENGKKIVEDFKGFQTKVFLLKKKFIISKIIKGEIDIVFRIVMKEKQGYIIKNNYDKNTVV